MRKNKEMIIKFQLPVEMIREEGSYVVSFLPLNAHGQGETEEEAIRSFKQAVQSVVEICLEEGTLEAILRDSGISVASLATQSQVPSQSLLTGQSRQTEKCAPGHKWRHITIPIPMVMADAHC